MRRSGIKSFGTKRSGKIILIVLAIALIAPSFVFLGALVTIPVILIFALALPIYTGWKIPRQLALAGLVILVVSAPIVAAGNLGVLLIPPGPVSSDLTSTASNGQGPVLANATANPFQGGPSHTYTFTVQFQPQYMPANFSPVKYVLLFVSNCPGATGPNSDMCAAGYPSFTNNTTIPNPTVAQTLRFTQTLPGVNIWYWQIGVAATNTTGALVWIFLDAMNNIGTVEGPLTGSSLQLYGFILPGFYEEVLLYGGATFYAALLAYTYFKSRERRRKEAQAAAAAASAVPAIEPGPTAGGPPGSAPPGTPPEAAVPQERRCPNCSAVVYPSEKTCWKCGSPLASPGSESPPLPSEKS